jgi:tRNA threonylcarbamoyladenosine biosynthesis protein TsaE
MNGFIFDAADERATGRLGAALAAAARPGLVVALEGPLGAGKTTLVRATAGALGVDERTVSSPTFVLLHQYQGRMPIFHFDAYRITCADEFLELGVDEYFASPALSLVEWADRVSDCLPTDRLTMRIEIAGAGRRFTITATGPESQRVLQRLAQSLRE